MYESSLAPWVPTGWVKHAPHRLCLTDRRGPYSRLSAEGVVAPPRRMSCEYASSSLLAPGRNPLRPAARRFVRQSQGSKDNQRGSGAGLSRVRDSPICAPAWFPSGPTTSRWEGRWGCFSGFGSTEPFRRYNGRCTRGRIKGGSWVRAVRDCSPGAAWFHLRGGRKKSESF